VPTSDSNLKMTEKRIKQKLSNPKWLLKKQRNCRNRQ